MRRNTHKIILLLLLLMAFSGLMTWAIIHQFYVLCGVALFFIMFVLTSIYYSINKTQRKVSHFFDAVENNDSTIVFNETTVDSTELELNKSLNRVNGHIKEVKKRLVAQEQYFKSIIEHASSGILCIDANAHVLVANKAALDLIGLQVLTHLQQIKNVDEGLYHCLSHDTGCRSISFNSPGGVVQLSLSTSVIKVDTKDLKLISLQDISSPLSDKELESWSKLTQVLTHEIMNNLAPIISLSQDIKRRLETSTLEPEKAKQAFEIIQSQSQGLLHFVESYRKFTKLPLPNKQNISIYDTFDRMRILFASFSPPEYIRFEAISPDEDFHLFVDEGQVIQVLINLLKNAIEAFEEESEGLIKLWAEKTDHKICLYISNNGSPIPEDIKDTIFVPFFTTKQDGSGIGLSLASQILRLHGGSIQLINSPGATVFCITLY